MSQNSGQLPGSSHGAVKRGPMPENPEERRQRDLRDLEVYRQRLRPTIADLWRTIEKSGENRITIASTPRRKVGNPDKRPLKTRPSLMRLIVGHDAGKSIFGEHKANPSESPTDRSDLVGPLVAALVVLFLLSCTGMMARVPLALPL
jgi:hypothetical protein